MEVPLVRRFLSAWLTAMLLVALAAAPVTARGPRCADFQSTSADGNATSGASWNGQTTGDVNARIFLAADSCDRMTYTLVILDDEESSTVLATQSVVGDGSDPFVIISIAGPILDPDGDVCAYVTSATKNKTVDRAPADGCVILLDNGTSPAGGKGF
jgi:hypothetical protein